MEYDIFLSENNRARDSLIIVKSEYLKQHQQFESAYNELNRLSALNAQHPKILYKKALNQFLLSDYEQAYNHMSMIHDSIKSQNHQYRYIWYLILAETYHFKKLKTLLLNDSSFQSISDEIKNIPTTYDYKSPKKARKMSKFLPGLGLFYSGNITKGVIALGLPLACGYFGYTQIISNYYASTLAFSIYPMLKFYKGGQRLAYSETKKYNERKIKSLKNRYLKIIKMF
jgi:hypothetical protein